MPAAAQSQKLTGNHRIISLAFPATIAHGKHSADKISGLKERQRQMEMAERRQDQDD